jgi:purine-binding chemotaxis protein CheW
MQYCTFFLDQQRYAVPMQEVQEVVLETASTPIPLAPDFARGLMNLRGNIVLSLDLRRRFGLPPRPAESAGVQMIVQSPSGWVGWLVDEIGDVLDLDPALAQPPPGTLRSPGKELLSGVFPIESGLVLVLNGKRILEVEPQGEDSLREKNRELGRE